MSQAQDATSEPRRQVNDFVCTACGCTCDDLRLTVEGRRVIEAQPPCPLAEQFLLQQPETPPASCLIDGQPADLNAALDRAAELLHAAAAPLVMGFERATIKSQRLAVEIADRLGGWIDPTGDHGQSRSHLAIQTVGAITATLGEVAARSNLVVYWNVDPAVTHPRHLERFARKPRTIADGGNSRRVITVAPARSQTSQTSDEFLELAIDGEVAALTVLRALLKGASLEAADVAAQTGAPLEQWRYLAQRLKMARYAVIFFEPNPWEGEAPAEPSPGTHSPARQEPRPPGNCDSDEIAQTMTDLVRELHRHTRAAALRLGAPWNAVGAAQVLTWQTGFPAAVSFAAGYPRYLPGEAAAQALLERGEVDAALIIGADPLVHWPKDAAARLASTPQIVIDDRESETSGAAAVAIYSARFGIESAGSVYRSDGVALPLRPAVMPQLPEAESILAQLAARLRDPSLSPLARTAAHQSTL